MKITAFGIHVRWPEMTCYLHSHVLTKLILKLIWYLRTLLTNSNSEVNSVDPDQTAHLGPV